MIRQQKLDDIVTMLLQEKKLTFTLERENLIKSSFCEGWLAGYKSALTKINEPQKVQ